MLKRHAAFFTLFRSLVDISIISLIWVIVYYIRFYSGLFDVQKGIPDFKRHLMLTVPIVCICYLSCLLTGLYKSKRMQNVFLLFMGILRTSILSGLCVMGFFYYLQNTPYSRKLLALFIFMLFVGLLFSHLFTVIAMRNLRKTGRNLRHYVVIGATEKGQQLVSDIEQMNWLGLKCAFFLDNNPSLIGTEVNGIPIYGPVDDNLIKLVREKEIDEVYLTIGGNEAQRIYPALESLQCAGITIRIIPDWGNLTSISSSTVITIGSQVLFSAADSPLNGPNIILKELFDRVVASVLLIIFAIPMALIAVLIKLTSKGPVLYKQIRIGADQKEFEILKFRTMKINAEQKTGPQWAKQNDARCTKIGTWLRKTSLDELPQLINVLKGELSLVGPRPERPFFVKQFFEEYKKYMFRHKVKPGITGWAQVNGLRGNTSLRKRLVYDLYYVKNWSFGLDLWILLRTPWHIIKGENAH